MLHHRMINTYTVKTLLRAKPLPLISCELVPSSGERMVNGTIISYSANLLTYSVVVYLYMHVLNCWYTLCI